MKIATVPKATATVYLADTLPARYPKVCAALTDALHAKAIPVAWLPGTRDVWARDYMPAVLPSGNLVRFRYSPDYLRGKRGQRTVTDAAAVCAALGLPAAFSALVLDGGNIVRGQNHVLMTDKVLRENAALPVRQTLRLLAKALEVERVTLLPADPQDFTGHADGMVHFVDERTVLVNDYRRREPALWASLLIALHNAGLDALPFPYNPYANATRDDATGIYINFLRVGSVVFVPVFGMPEDEVAIGQLTQAFSNHVIIPISAGELAPGGGLLHCISWVF